jgi:hypothetical protein
LAKTYLRTTEQDAPFSMFNDQFSKERRRTKIYGIRRMNEDRVAAD